jgi:hypothetical protein
MNLSIDYRLAGSGWAECTISDEQASCEITASYLSDALGRLVVGAIGLATGLSSVSFCFDEEPGEYRWVIQSVGINEISIEMLAFDELWGGKPDKDGKSIFVTKCRPVVFARAVHRAATAILDQFGVDGYLKKWHAQPFPSRQLELLGEILARRDVDG